MKDKHSVQVNINRYQTVASNINEQKKKDHAQTLKWSKKDMFYEKLSSNVKPFYNQVAQLMRVEDE